jgi:hypothetical protein
MTVDAISEKENMKPAWTTSLSYPINAMVAFIAKSITSEDSDPIADALRRNA